MDRNFFGKFLSLIVLLIGSVFINTAYAGYTYVPISWDPKPQHSGKAHPQVTANAYYTGNSSDLYWPYPALFPFNTSTLNTGFDCGDDTDTLTVDKKLNDQVINRFERQCGDLNQELEGYLTPEEITESQLISSKKVNLTFRFRDDNHPPPVPRDSGYVQNVIPTGDGKDNEFTKSASVTFVKLSIQNPPKAVPVGKIFTLNAVVDPSVPKGNVSWIFDSTVFTEQSRTNSSITLKAVRFSDTSIKAETTVTPNNHNFKVDTTIPIVVFTAVAIITPDVELNWDDDNGNDAADRRDSGKITADRPKANVLDDDFQILDIGVSPNVEIVRQGKTTLTIDGPTSPMVIWNSNKRGTEITSGKQFSNNDLMANKRLFLEAIWLPQMAGSAITITLKTEVDGEISQVSASSRTFLQPKVTFYTTVLEDDYITDTRTDTLIIYKGTQSVSYVAKKSFVEKVIIEGAGRLSSPVTIGSTSYEYIGYDGINYTAYHVPEGAGTPLTDDSAAKCKLNGGALSAFEQSTEVLIPGLDSYVSSTIPYITNIPTIRHINDTGKGDGDSLGKWLDIYIPLSKRPSNFTGNWKKTVDNLGVVYSLYCYRMYYE